jgi:hypothetical protein
VSINLSLLEEKVDSAVASQRAPTIAEASEGGTAASTPGAAHRADLRLVSTPFGRAPVNILWRWLEQWDHSACSSIKPCGTSQHHVMQQYPSVHCHSIVSHQNSSTQMNSVP